MSYAIGIDLNQAAAQTDRGGSADAWCLYATEVLDHLRLGYQLVDGDDLSEDIDVLIMAAGGSMTTERAERVADWVGEGGVLIGVGDPGQIAGLAGVRSGGQVDHGHVRFEVGDVIDPTPDVALRAIGGVRLIEPAPDVRVLASWRPEHSPAVTVRSSGEGAVIWFGVDVWQSIVRIQQGLPVTADGLPAADGSAPIDDGILKCEDGLVLDFEQDRELPPGQPELADYRHVLPPETGLPMFHRPHADLWRTAFLQSVWWAMEHVGVPQAWLYYWPADVPAIAHMSHDSDQNVDEDARAALDAFAEAGVHVTWCQVFPGGYQQATYPAITEAGHEQALHFNAMGDANIASWGWPQFRAQYAWAQAVTGSEHIVANKNHYTRWEEFTEFYRWCERTGIQIDESRGPSKQGTIGFPFGTAHVSFPIADQDDHNRYYDVLNLPLHTQDLALAGHVSVRDVILDAALDQHGVAHFLFHGVHLNRRPDTRKECIALVEEARRRGMLWWTAGEINDWERRRRMVQLTITGDQGTLRVCTRAEQEIPDAGVLILVPGHSTAQLIEGAGRLSTVLRHGRQFIQLAADIPAGETSWRLVTA